MGRIMRGKNGPARSDRKPGEELNFLNGPLSKLIKLYDFPVVVLTKFTDGQVNAMVDMVGIASPVMTCD